MGVVYEAVHEQIGQRVAAKVLYLQLAQQPEYMERFVREARASSMIRHDGLAKIFDFGLMEGGPPYILMEFLEGDLLRTRMDHLPPPQRMDVPHALRIARQIASALAAAHDKGVVHRDLKPENLMLVSDSEAPSGERVKILDFGVAKFLASPHRTSMRGGQILGTPQYMSPEQCRGARDIGPRSDVYSLGVLLYEMLTGSLPVDGTTQQLLAKHLAGPPPTVIARTPSLPPQVSELVARMMALKPDARPEMTEVTAAIKQLRTELADPSETNGPSAWSDAMSTSSTTSSNHRALPAEFGAAYSPTEPGAELGKSLGDDFAFLPTADANARRPADSLHGFQSWIAAIPRGTKRTARTTVIAIFIGCLLLWGVQRLLSGPRPMVLMPADSYLMGSSREEASSAYEWSLATECPDCDRELFAREQPARVVTISAFYIDSAEVRNDDFASWLSANRSLSITEGHLVYAAGTLLYDLAEQTPRPGEPTDPVGIVHTRGRFTARPGMAQLPVAQVTWDAALRYCEDQGKRLPTEAEWEYAARGVEGRRFPWGELQPTCEGVLFGRAQKLRCASYRPGPAPVRSASQDVSPLGVYDLGGNVAEWVLDRARHRYPECPEPCRDPLASNNQPQDGGLQMRVVRGGAFNRPAYVSRGAGRAQRAQDQPAVDIGFRCVKPAR